MSFTENPFTPSFGDVPARLAGRQEILRSMARALESENRRPDLTTLFVGARGTGKTTLLSALSRRADQMGWVSVSVTALPGMLEDIECGLRRNAAHLLDMGGGVHVSQIGIGSSVSVALEAEQMPSNNWRNRMTSLVESLNEIDTGLLITVDEVDPQLDELVTLAAVYQHFVREGRRVALVMAGLPHNVNALLDDKTASFLRRARQRTLRPIEQSDVRCALVATIEDGGRKADPEGVQLAVEAIGGFPFLMQLVGYHAWEEDISRLLITRKDFERGIDLAHAEMDSSILRATYRSLSPGDRSFARAMLADAKESRVSDIAERLGKSASAVSHYRRRLIDAGVIGERERGVVGFDLPFFREYLAAQSES